MDLISVMALFGGVVTVSHGYIAELTYASILYLRRDKPPKCAGIHNIRPQDVALREQVGSNETSRINHGW